MAMEFLYILLLIRVLWKVLHLDIGNSSQVNSSQLLHASIIATYAV